MIDIISNYTAQNWHNFINMVPITSSKSGDELFKEQQTIIVTKMKEYIFERKWYQNFGDVVFVLIMRALNLKII